MSDKATPPSQDHRDPEPVGHRPDARRLLRSTGTVGGWTLLSRILGLVRDIVYARLFGATYVMDAFFVAFRIPNIFRRFFAEGSFSQAFVPVFAEYDQSRKRAEVQELVDRAAGTLGAILLVIAAVGSIAAPLFVALFAPGFISGEEGLDAGLSADRYALAVDMLRWTFPYLLFVSLAALAGGILNTYHRFVAAAFSPVLLNVVLIVFAVWVAPHFARPGMALAIGVFVAGILQLACMLPSLARLRLLPRPRWGWGHSGVRQILKLMIPGLFGSSVAQISILLDTLIASFLVTGSISWLYYSDRIMEFPLGVFGIALATVMLPNLSRQHAAQAPEDFSRTLDWALRLVVLIVVPAALGLMILAGPMLTTLFYGGAFREHDVAQATWSLVAYAAGLMGFTLVKVLAPGYFARQNTATPVRIGLIALGSTMTMNIVLVVPYALLGGLAPHAGLAATTSIGSFINAGLLYRGLRRTGAFRPQPGWGRFLLQVLSGVVLMSALLVLLAPPTPDWLAARGWVRALWLAAAVIGSALAYFATLLAVGLRPAALRLLP
ncbi:MAG: murein biosynthesis integral membrane protein MurJ [Gammaproteobacteria bacterium PRO9]|nr:murein biosynthesis integral membrane protein MurJ [Gammaproteobacteria bacterium PRO9]